MTSDEKSILMEKIYYFPWVRKGLSNRLIEVDTLGVVRDDLPLAKRRPVLSITTEHEVIPPIIDTKEKKEKESPKKSPMSVSETKDVQFISPGDIISVNSDAILKSAPKNGGDGFAVQHFPYIEFWEPDFLWRYTPACPNGDRLRPWLALLVCEESLCSVKKRQQMQYVSFSIENNGQYENIFPHPKNAWRSGHAQGFAPEEPNFCRLIALRAANELAPYTKYLAFLVPAFETGRLRGLGLDNDALQDVVAQAHAWEANIEEQKRKHPKQPLDFPVYYSWSFETGEDSFDGLVEKLKIASGFSSDIKIDVTRMGEGLDYNLFESKPEREIIGMPAATQTLDYEMGSPFPMRSGDETELYEHLKELLSYNPVFLENRIEISGESSDVGDDDPWVVPPVYGGKHIMATSIDELKNEKNETPWFSRLNLDIHYRAVAGLGKRTIQIHQEEFVNRAWKQVEAVNALNNELYYRLLSVNTNKSLRNKAFKSVEDDSFISNMMQYLGSMKNAQVKGADGSSVTSLSAIMADSSIPQSFASASFQFLTEQTAKLSGSLDPTTLMENIAEKQIFRLSDYSLCNSPDIDQLSAANIAIQQIILDDICKTFFSRYFVISKRALGDSEKLPPGEISRLYTLTAKKISISNEYYVKPPIEKPVGVGAPQLPGYMMTSPTTPGIGVAATSFGYYYNYLIYRGGMDSFLDGDAFREHICYGIAGYGESVRATSSYSPIYNLLGIDDGKYEEMFGPNTIVTRVGGEKGLYFVSKKKLKEALEGDGGCNGVKFYTCFENQSGHNMRDKDGWTLKKDTIIYSRNHFSVGGQGSSSTGLGVPLSCFYSATAYKILTWHAADSSNDGGERRRALDALKKDSDSLKEDEYYKRLIEFFITTPDEIELDLGKFPKDKIQGFNTIETYVEFLKSRTDSTNASELLQMWIQLNGFVKQLEENRGKGLFGEKPAERIVDNSALIKLSQSMQDIEAYERMRRVAESYYAEFFADSPSGKALRDGYIDELLRSKYPILAYPIFPEPVYYYLKMFSEKFILPCVDELPADSVAVFRSNAEFEEAYLCGMNTEMGKELLWREYPTDQRGSYFRKFWDSETSVADIRSENFFDIEPVHTWTGDLGDNHLESKTGLLIFAIKGVLMRRYPNTQVFLHRAAKDKEKPQKLCFDMTATEENSGIILPVMQAFLKDDIFMVGFKGRFEELLGNPKSKDFGYFLTFKEDVTDLNFEEEDNDNGDEVADAAQFAEWLKNEPTLYGKHMSLFII